MVCENEQKKLVELADAAKIAGQKTESEWTEFENLVESHRTTLAVYIALNSLTEARSFGKSQSVSPSSLIDMRM